jgi:hypothetical protein
MGRDGCACQLDRGLVALRVVGVAMRVDDVRDRQALRGGALDHRLRRVGGINQHRLAGVTIAQQIGEVAVAADADLLEYQLHEVCFLLMLICRNAAKAVRPAMQRQG